jgi:hypothetical protein
MSSVMRRSDLFDHNARNTIRHILEPVHDFFQVVVDLEADDVVHGVAAAVLQEQRFKALVVEHIGLFLEVDDLLGDGVQPRVVLAQRAKHLDGFHR